MVQPWSRGTGCSVPSPTRPAAVGSRGYRSRHRPILGWQRCKPASQGPRSERPGAVKNKAGLRVGVYVDVENIVRTAVVACAFDVLRDFACRDGADAIRLNAYLAFDEERAQRDLEYRSRATRYHFALRDVGFKVIEKPVRWYTNEDGGRVSKANSDLDLAVDLLLQSAKLDRVVLVTGDGDFVQVVRALQNVGCRVELLAFQNVSYNLRCEVDLFLSGYLIPGLLPVPAKTPAWSEIGSRSARHVLLL